MQIICRVQSSIKWNVSAVLLCRSAMHAGQSGAGTYILADKFLVGKFILLPLLRCARSPSKVRLCCSFFEYIKCNAIKICFQKLIGGVWRIGARLRTVLPSFTLDFA
jgi:hypothetical protein